MEVFREGNLAPVRNSPVFPVITGVTVYYDCVVVCGGPRRGSSAGARVNSIILKIGPLKV